MNRPNWIYLFSKRIFDFFLALIGILITSPIWILTVIGIELSDPGPIFYIAKRVGKDNKVFGMYKFRSMRQGKANEAVFRGDEDRIFPFGALIRKLKIDELPQFINVLVGKMSFVGPRPAAVDQIESMRGGEAVIASSVVPGITGPAALYDYLYGDTITSEEDYLKLVLPTRVKLEAIYPMKMSFLFDMKMIYYTIICICGSIFHLQLKGIYERIIELSE